MNGNEEEFSSFQRKSVRERLQEKIGFCPKGILNYYDIIIYILITLSFT